MFSIECKNKIEFNIIIVLSLNPHYDARILIYICVHSFLKKKTIIIICELARLCGSNWHERISFRKCTNAFTRVFRFRDEFFPTLEHSMNASVYERETATSLRKLIFFLPKANTRFDVTYVTVPRRAQGRRFSIETPVRFR